MSLTSREAALLDRIARTVDGNRLSYSSLPADQQDVARNLVRLKYLRCDWDGGDFSLTASGRHALDEYHDQQRQQAEERERQREAKLSETVYLDDQHQKDRRNNLIAAIVGALIGALVTAVLSYLIHLS